MQTDTRILKLSHQLYRWLLIAYPNRFKQEYGPLMEQVFRDDTRFTLQDDGLAGLVDLWFLTMLDLVKTAIAEHVWEVFHMPMEKLQRWSGPAIAIGGPLWVVSLFWFVRYSQGAAGLILTSLPFIITATLLAVGMIGLARSLPDQSNPRLLIALTVGGLIVNNAAMLVLFASLDFPTGPPSNFSPLSMMAAIISGLGGVSMTIGLVLIGIVAYTSKSLGKLSIAPLVPPAAIAIIGVLIMTESDIAGLFTLAYLVYSAGWVLIGIGLSSVDQGHSPDLSAPA